MALPVDQQYAIIRDSDFIERIQTKGIEITGMLAGAGVSVDGIVSWQINDIAVAVKIISPQDCEVSAGEGPNGPLYKWTVPLNWLTTEEDQVLPGDPA